MSVQPYLSRLYIYPIKSLDRVAIARGTLLSGGAIASDREWAIFDESGKFVNGKNNAKVHLIRSTWDLNAYTVTLGIQDTNNHKTFKLDSDRREAEAWLSDYFGITVYLQQNLVTGYPDDTHAAGPTIISTATVETVASWFPHITVEEMRLRLRANLEIAGVPAFWEDRLFDSQDNHVSFKIGEVIFWGINPCQRCVVPTRDSQTGAQDAGFTKQFIRQRQETLPDWTNRDRFNHFYRLSVNTQVPPSETGKEIHVGDELVLL